MIQVGIMGSNSDWPVMQQAAQFLKEFGVEYEARVVSAHRTPDLMFEYAGNRTRTRHQVSLPAQAAPAHLPGMVAAKTTVPVLGVPVSSKYLRAAKTPLLSIVQMPKGVPVATLPLAKPVRPMQLFAISLLANENPGWLKNWRLSVPNKNKPFLAMELPEA